MLNGIAYPGTQSLTYRRGEESKYPKVGSLQGRAARVEDFFRSSDNTEIDLDPRPGVIYISGPVVPGFVENRAEFVSGKFDQASGSLSAKAATKEGAQARIVIEKQKGLKTIFFESDAFINSSFLGSISSLSENPDGTLTFASAFKTD